MSNVRSLSDAVWDGNLADVNAMIAAGADVNVAEDPHFPPLHLAIEQQWVEIVRRLIEAGANVNFEPEPGWTPLLHAIDTESDVAWQSHHETGHESTEMTELLLASGATPTPSAFTLAQTYSNRKALALLEAAKQTP